MTHLTNMFRIALLLFLLPVTSFAQPKKKAADKNMQYLQSNIASGKIKGSIYDAKRIILFLSDQDTTQDYLIDSIAYFNQLTKDKISFLAYFNDVASDIKIGYVEINLSANRTKVLFLNDLLLRYKTTFRKGIVTTYISTKSYVRHGSATFLWYTISSQTSKSRFFTFSRRSKNVRYSWDPM